MKVADHSTSRRKKWLPRVARFSWRRQMKMVSDDDVMFHAIYLPHGVFRSALNANACGKLFDVSAVAIVILRMSGHRDAHVARCWNETHLDVKAGQVTRIDVNCVLNRRRSKTGR